MKKAIYLIIIAVFALTAFLRGEVSFAQSNAVQKAFENVKNRIDELITAKDENKFNELAVRIETFKKVIDLSTKEAQDLKLKLLTTDRENIEDWRKKMVAELNLIIKSYGEKKQELENRENILNIDTLKGLAESFKRWREENYTDVANQVREFLLIVEEEKSIRTAEKRAQMIGEDLRRLERAKIKGVADLKQLLATANDLIEEAAALNKLAEMNFFDLYILQSSTDSPTTTSTPTSTSPFKMPDSEITNNSDASTTTSTAPLSAETPLSGEAEPSPPSVKDLVRSSLEKIKEAYQVFIEMSNLVRKLLR